MCNLSEVVIRPQDTLEILKKKVEIATIIGTFQSTLTDFRYLRTIWKKNAEEERLLGVSLTGIMDHPVLSKVCDEAKEWLTELRQVAIGINKEWANKLSINQSVAITCCKPSGTVSELVDSSPGIHPRFSKYYLRSIRNDQKDPITKLMQDQGVPNEQDVMNPTNVIFSFPKKSPEESVIREEITAIQQLDHYKMIKDYWTEHNPSCTIYIKPNEWLAVGDWIYRNWDDVGGVSFLPYSDHVYKQAPFQEIDKETYEKLLAEMPEINFSKIAEYENDDMTAGSQELACVAGSCAI